MDGFRISVGDDMKISDETILWANNEMLRIKMNTRNEPQILCNLMEAVENSNPHLNSWVNDFVNTLGPGFIFGFAMAMKMVEVQEVQIETAKLRELYERE